ncbi:MAG: Sir2 family NAD+-dependent deacetylase [Arenicella sp.]
MKKPNSIVILTGAGVSAESGIATFRASDGLWENHRIEDVASPEGFARDPELVQNFYNQRRRQLLSDEIKPNAAHRALATLEQKFAGDVLLITQNIDNLHERAGSKNVLHMHGELLQMRCQISDVQYTCRQDISVEDRCECCQQTGNLRPNIVWFGEMPLFMDDIYHALAECDLFVAIGTSGNVYPAAGFIEVARQAGADGLEINMEKSLVANAFTDGVYGPATQCVPQWVQSLCG